MAEQSTGRLAIKAFLSHQYKATAINTFFFTLFAKHAEVQFEVDEGTFATNVTRLERKVRKADAFIGIYPYSGAKDNDSLRRASRYFRLELELAVRSRKPTLIFYDERYRNLLKGPPGVQAIAFNSQQLTSEGDKPTEKFLKAFAGFCELVAAEREYDVRVQLQQGDDSIVGLLLSKPSYSADAVREIERLLGDAGYDRIRHLPSPAVLNTRFFEELAALDFAIVDVGDPELAPIVAFLHDGSCPCSGSNM